MLATTARSPRCDGTDGSNGPIGRAHGAALLGIFLFGSFFLAYRAPNAERLAELVLFYCHGLVDGFYAIKPADKEHSCEEQQQHSQDEEDRARRDEKPGHGAVARVASVAQASAVTFGAHNTICENITDDATGFDDTSTKNV